MQNLNSEEPFYILTDSYDNVLTYRSANVVITLIHF